MLLRKKRYTSDPPGLDLEFAMAVQGCSEARERILRFCYQVVNTWARLRQIRCNDVVPEVRG
jgi:hypothetical protein